MNKICMKCGVEKCISEFYKHKQMIDGHLNKCKECTKADVRENRAKNIEYYRDFDKKRANRPDRVKARIEYAQTEAGRNSQAKAKRKYIETNPIKRSAHVLVGNAIRDGRLVKQPCESCGTGKNIHAHHPDYAYPLSVMWLCASCHADWHKENEAINGDMPYDEDPH